MGPDLGDGFVLACLSAHGFNAERTLDALLTDSLPPGLKTLDRQLQVWHDPADLDLVPAAQAGPSGSGSGPAGPASSAGAGTGAGALSWGGLALDAAALSRADAEAAAARAAAVVPRPAPPGKKAQVRGGGRCRCQFGRPSPDVPRPVPSSCGVEAKGELCSHSDSQPLLLHGCTSLSLIAGRKGRIGGRRRRRPSLARSRAPSHPALPTGAVPDREGNLACCCALDGVDGGATVTLKIMSAARHD
jgi:hypothetical protein